MHACIAAMVVVGAHSEQLFCLSHAGIVSDRVARFNYDVKLSLLKAQLKLTGQPSVIQHYDHCMDFMTQLRVNKLCSQLGLEMPFPLLNPAELQDPEQSDTAADADLTAAGAVGHSL